MKPPKCEATPKISFFLTNCCQLSTKAANLSCINIDDLIILENWYPLCVSSLSNHLLFLLSVFAVCF